MQILKTENKRTTNILPLLAVGTFSLHLVTLLALMFHGNMLQELQRKEASTSMVQLANGSTIEVDPQQYLERYPETIRRFVGQTMTLMFTWSEQQPPRTIWLLVSELLSNDSQSRFEKEVNDLITQNQLVNISEGTETAFVIRRISQPEQIEEGKWKVQMLANLLVFRGTDPQGQSTPFNKQILVQVTDEPAMKLPQTRLPWHLAVRRLSEAKLEIYKICDIQDKNCSKN
jgi:hypothetical protein